MNPIDHGEGMKTKLTAWKAKMDALMQKVTIRGSKVRIPTMSAIDSRGKRPPIPEQGGRFLSERSDAGFS